MDAVTTGLVVRPDPQVRAVQVVPADPRVPLAARRMDAAASRSGWLTALEYARGNGIASDGGVGPVVESVVLRARSGHRQAVAFWTTAAVAVCPKCAGLFVPTGTGKFRQHGPKGGELCDGGGQPAVLRDVEPGSSSYAFGSAYVRGWGGRWERVKRADGLREVFDGAA